MPASITSTEDGDRALRRHAYIDFVPRAVNALPLLRAGALTWLVSAETADAGWARHFGVHTCSLEHQHGVRRDVRRGPMDSLPAPPPDAAAAPRALVASRWTVPEPWLAFCTAASDAPGPAGAAGPHEELADKVKMREWFARLGVPVPAGVVVAHAGLTHTAVRRQVGTPFVLQRPVGKGGSGTYLVRDEHDLVTARAAEPDADRWLASEYVAGTTLNFHGIVHLDGAVGVARPSVQTAGITEVGPDFGSFCGCDFLAPGHLPPAALDRARKAVGLIGSGLAAHGYRGLFGVDLVVRDDSVLVLELNARSQGSTWLLGEIERAEGRAPLLLRHVLERYGSRTGTAEASDPEPGAQLGVRHLGATATATVAPPSGIYALHGERLVWRRAGFGVLECAEDEYLVVGVPRPGRELRPRASLGMLASRRPMSRPDGQALNAAGHRLVTAFRALFTLSERTATADGAAAVSGVTAG